MDPVTALAAFSVAALLLTLTPGLDMALVLRTATVEGPRAAMSAGVGICLGVLAWGVLASLGLGALLAVSEVGYQLLMWAGAGYLIWLGVGMLRASLRGDYAVPDLSSEAGQGGRGWFWRGLLTNLLNPKVGVFYVSFLPQFLPVGVPAAAFGIGLAAIHAAMGLVFFAALTKAIQPFGRLLRRPAFARGMDGVTGAVLVGFGARLLSESRG